MRAGLRTAAAAALAATAVVAGFAQAPAASIDEILTRVGDRIADFYKRAASVVCIEKSTVQPIGFNYAPDGFARTVESELHVEVDGEDGTTEAKVVRDIRKVNGRPPREKDKKARASCTDPNPLSPEPLAFLLPSHRGDYDFNLAGTGKEKDRPVLLVDFVTKNRRSRLELTEDPLGREDCFDWNGDVALKGRVWIDAATYDVVRVDEHFTGPVDIRVSAKLQRRYNFSNWVLAERYDKTIRYRIVPFTDPEETLLLPDSIDSMMVFRGGLESTRRRQSYTEYKRFLTGGRIVK